jgi:hypothetical protein
MHEPPFRHGLKPHGTSVQHKAYGVGLPGMTQFSFGLSSYATVAVDQENNFQESHRACKQGKSMFV